MQQEDLVLIDGNRALLQTFAIDRRLVNVEARLQPEPGCARTHPIAAPSTAHQKT